MQDPLIIIKNLNITLQKTKKKLIENFNLKLQNGHILGIVGESGSGKSLCCQTILKLLDKEIFNVTGEIIFDGKNILNIDDKSLNKIRGKQIAYIPQDPVSSLNPLYTIRKQFTSIISNHFKNLEESSKIEIIKNAFINVHLNNWEEVLDKYPYQLSGGMKQRILIAFALSLNPKVIIADEITTALDVTVANQILKLIKEINKKLNISIIFISHDLSIVSSLCDTIAVMYSGKIFEIVQACDFYDKSLHPYSIDLISCIPTIDTNKLQSISGNVPELTQLFDGCRYNNRCKIKIDRCSQNEPELVQSTTNHYVACFMDPNQNET